MDGLSLEESSLEESADSFALGLVVVYLTLAAQYESYVLPFIVLLAVPVAVLGAIGAQALRGLQERRLLPDRSGYVDRACQQECDF